ncbi:hypothetical protein ABRT01_17565 [Lentibacillus sp. L22]|uniref:hypothetical protein n=1 Tax=Lentibacillus TaxID=175304 RepID=UPI0022B0E26C|nr:hypothetical protein [Lentibacillus daqui]
MRILVIFAVFATVLTVLYKWRYKLLNMVLAFALLRKISVVISMNMPTIKDKILPKLFNKQVEQQA